MVISLSTEISLKTWACFPTFSAAVLSASTHTSNHTHTQREREGRVRQGHFCQWSHLGHACAPTAYIKGTDHLRLHGRLALNHVGHCLMFESNTACFFNWQHTWKGMHAHTRMHKERSLCYGCCNKSAKNVPETPEFSYCHCWCHRGTNKCWGWAKCSPVPVEPVVPLPELKNKTQRRLKKILPKKKKKMQQII